MKSLFFERRHAWIGLVLLCVGLALLIDGWRGAQDARRLELSGQAAAGSVTDHRTAEDHTTASSDHVGSETTYYVSYRLPTLGLDKIYERKVPRAFYDAHPIGSEIAMRVLPQNPDVHALFEGELETSSTGALIVGLVLSVLGAVLFWLKGGLDRVRRSVQNEQTPL